LNIYISIFYGLISRFTACSATLLLLFYQSNFSKYFSFPLPTACNEDCTLLTRPFYLRLISSNYFPIILISVMCVKFNTSLRTEFSFIFKNLAQIFPCFQLFVSESFTNTCSTYFDRFYVWHNPPAK
jgi:hypothetical protein